VDVFHDQCEKVQGFVLDARMKVKVKVKVKVKYQ